MVKLYDDEVVEGTESQWDAKQGEKSSYRKRRDGKDRQRDRYDKSDRRRAKSGRPRMLESKHKPDYTDYD